MLPLGPNVILDARGVPVGAPVGSPPPLVDAAGNKVAAATSVPISGLNANGNLQMFALDATGALTVRNALAPTWTFCSNAAVSTTTTAGRSMLSIYNASTTNYQRVVSLFANCPPQLGQSGTLLGSSSTSYQTIFFGAYRITGHTGGTLLTGVAHDALDDAALDVGVCTVRYGATVSGEGAASLYQWDAAYNGRQPVGTRADIGARVWTLPPTSGLHFKCLTTLSTAVGFLMTATLAQNIA